MKETALDPYSDPVKQIAHPDARVLFLVQNVSLVTYR